MACVPTDLHVFADGAHAFDSMMPGTAVAQRAARTLEDWLELHLHPGGRGTGGRPAIPRPPARP